MIDNKYRSETNFSTAPVANECERGDIKTFTPEAIMYASANNDASSLTTTDDYTVFNQSGKDVYYKPEDGRYGTRNRIPNGRGIKDPVDGIATSKSSDQVFKIPGKSIARPSALVTPGGEVKLNFDAIDKVALSYKYWKVPDYKYGWLSIDELDSNWKNLFRLAEIIKYSP